MEGRRRESLAGEEESFEFEGFPQGEKEDQITYINKQLMGLIRWRGVVENWRREIGAKLEALSESGDGAVKQGSGDGLEVVMGKVDELVSENVALKAQLNEYQNHLNEKVKEIDSEYREKAEKEIRELREENEKLRRGFETNQDRTEKMEVEVSEMKNVWGSKVEEAEVNLKAIIEEQKERQEENLGKKVVKAIRQNERQVCDIMDKKRCVIMFGDVEGDIPDRSDRKVAEMKKVDDMIEVLDRGGREGWKKEVEDIWRLGKYKKGVARPIKIRFKSTKTVEDVLRTSWKLSQEGKYRDVILRKDLNAEEREKMREVSRQVREENEKRSEADKENFYYRNLDGRMKKWYLKRKGRQVEGEREEVGVAEVKD